MIGQQFGPYEIVDVIGRGGMATVYRAWEPTVDRYVALKVLSHDILEDPNLLKRFQREARTVANLEHRAIVPVYAFGEHDGQPYIAMRYLDAGTLRKKLYYEEVTLGEAGRLIAQTAEALDYAHQRGVIHRDLKPSNILLDSVGNAYLTDFGIARILGSTSQITEGSGVIGTPSYMSPEQCQGKTLGPASDIYALGAILFEIVTGRTPYQADAPLTVMYMHVRDPIPSVRAIDPTLPEALEAVLMQALAKKPQDRFPTAGALAEAFNHAIHQPLGAPPPSQTPPPGVPIRARPPVPETDPSKELYIGPPTGYSEPVVDDLDDEPKPSGEGVRPPISGRTFAASFLGFVLLVGLIGGGVLLANSIQDEGRGLAAEPTLPPTVTPTSIDIVVTSIPTRGESTTIPVVEPSITPSATVTLSGIATATPSFTPGTAPVQPTNTPRPTTAVQPTASSTATPTVTLSPTSTPTATTTATATATATVTLTPTQVPVSAGGILLYTQGDPGADPANAQIVRASDNGQNPVILADNPWYDGEPDWSPDGQQIAFESEEFGTADLFLMNADGSGRQQLTDTADPDRHPDWHPSGDLIVYESGRNETTEILVVNVETELVTQLTNNDWADRAPQFNPAGTRIAFMTQENGDWQIAIMSYPGGVVERIFECPDADCRFPAWSPDGTRIIYNTLTASGQVGPVYSVDIATGASQLLIDLPASGRVIYAANGAYIYFNRTVAGSTDIYRYNVATQQVEQITAGDDDIYGPDWLSQ